MPSEFPFPSVNAAYPQPLFYEMQAEEFVVGVTYYDDGGADYKLQAGGAGVLRFIVRYDGLTSAQAAILDSWLATVFYSEDNGSAYGFNFRHHIGGEAWTSTNGTLYANCHVAPGGFKKGHIKVEIQSREFLIIRRP